MIKKIIYTLLLTLNSIIISAQKDFVPEWNMGISLGTTFSSIDFQPKLETKSWMQYQAGIAARYISESHLGIIAELNYSQQGWEQDFKETPQYSSSHQLNYLQIPFLTHIYFGNKVRFFINIGPQIGILLSEKETINDNLANLLSSGTMQNGSPTYQYYRNADTKIDYGLLAGLGLEFVSPIGNFALEGRYYFGFGDIYNNSKTDYFDRSANRVMGIKLTYYTKLF